MRIEHAGRLVANGVIFNLGWFACVLGGNAVALWVVPLLLLAHWALLAREAAEWSLIAAVTVLGILIDGLVQALGALRFNGSGWPVPLWLMLLWPMFATLLNHSLRFFQAHPWLAALLGGVSGPMTYLLGVEFGAATAVWSTFALFAIYAVVWALLLPLLLSLMQRRQPILEMLPT
jgi:hypothetical protein